MKIDFDPLSNISQSFKYRKAEHRHMQVFQLQFAVGEFDMVVHNPRTLTCEIYEIKYSKEVVPEQYQHLANQEKCDQTEHRFGTITDRYVIYRGESKKTAGIQYLNVEEYLKNCKESMVESLIGNLSNMGKRGCCDDAYCGRCNSCG